MGSFVHFILHIGPCPPQGTSLEVSLPPYNPSSHAPPLLLSSLRCSLSSARFLPHTLSLATSTTSSVPSSLVHFINPPFLYSRSHPPSHHCFLTPSRCSIPTHPPLAPSLQSSILPSSFPASLPSSNSMYIVCVCVCVWKAAMSRPQLCSTETMTYS